MKPSELLENLIKQYFKDCKRKDSQTYRVDLFCNDYKVVIEKSNLGFTSFIFDKNNQQRYRSSLNEIIAYSMSKQFGLKNVYEEEFKNLKKHLEYVKYEDKIKGMFEKNQIKKINQELNIAKSVDFKKHIIKRYAREFGYIFDTKIKSLVKENNE